MDKLPKRYWATSVQIDTDNLNRVLGNLEKCKTLDTPNADTDYWGLAVGYWQGCLLESESGLRAAE